MIKCSLKYRPDKICCFTSCPQCGRYIGEEEIPNPLFYDTICQDEVVLVV